MNFVVIFDEGKVCHFSMNETVPEARGILFQLPKSNGFLGYSFCTGNSCYSGTYFGYSDAKGILYFIHSNITQSITKFHKKLNKKGRKVIQGSKYKLMEVCEDLGFWDLIDQDTCKEQPFEYTKVKSFCKFSSAVGNLI